MPYTLFMILMDRCLFSLVSSALKLEETLSCVIVAQPFTAALCRSPRRGFTCVVHLNVANQHIFSVRAMAWRHTFVGYAI
jgi:hypothetical protein